MGRRALLNGKNTCKGQDLLIKCETWCRELDLPDVTKGCLDTTMIKNAVWAKNEKELEQMIANRPKINDRYLDDRKNEIISNACHSEIHAFGSDNGVA